MRRDNRVPSHAKHTIHMRDSSGMEGGDERRASPSADGAVCTIWMVESFLTQDRVDPFLT